MRTSYHPIAKFFHWSIVLIIAIQFISSWFMSGLRFGSLPNIFNTIHFSAISFFAIPLAVGLFFFRFYKPVEKNIKDGEEWMDKAATAMQYALYVLLLVVPISGWVSVSIRHLPIDFFGLFYFPVLNVVNPSLLYSFGRMHGDISNILGFLALGHIAAAIFHHFVLRDLVLRRMLPGSIASDFNIK